MVKILVSIVALSVFLFAGNVNSSLQAQYDEALKSYKAKDFKNSYKILSKIYLSNLSNANLNYYLGRSAYETGRYEMALAAFERVEMLDPSSLRNKLEMARTYYMLKMYEDSELAYKEVLDNPNIPENVRTNIELSLSNVSKVQQKSFTYANLKIDWLYDSNVNYGSLDAYYNINVGTFPSEPERSDTAFQVYGDISNIYDIGSKGGFAIKNKVDVYLKDYSDEDAYDIQYIAYIPSLIYRETGYLLELSGSYNLLKIGGTEYLKTLWAMPRGEYSHTNTLRSLAHFKYQKKTFSQKAQHDLDATHYELAYALQKILSPSSYIQGNIRGIREEKEHGTRVDVDYDEYRLSAVYANQLTATYGTELFGEYRNRGYKDASSLFFGTIRDDDALALAAMINAKILPTFRVHLKGTYDRVESNQARFSYDKYTMMLGVNKVF